MNRQPFYHRATVLFTATRALTDPEVEAMLQKAIAAVELEYEIVPGSTQLEELEDPEPGDPADLL